MNQERSTRFTSEHKLTNPHVVQAIIALSNNDRPPETIWRTPTATEWRRVVRVVAESGDDESVTLDDRMAWAFLWGLCEGTLHVRRERNHH
jgi:hypothetical protein